MAQFQINLAPGFGPRKLVSYWMLGAWHFSIEGAPGRVQFRLAVVSGDHVLNVWRNICGCSSEGFLLRCWLTMKNP